MSEWKEYKIKELGLIVTGKTPSSKFPDEFGDAMPFVTPTDYRNFRKWTAFAERSLSEKGIEKLRNKILPPSSVLVTCIGSDMGKVVMNKVPVITNQQINSIIPNQELVFPDFLYYKLVDNYETLRMHGQAGTAVPIVNKGDFEEINLPIPIDLEEQKSIASILSSLDDKIDLLHRQNKTSEALAETLFRQWFVEEAEEGWEKGKLGDVIELIYGNGLKEEIRSGAGFPVVGSSGIVGYHSEFLVEGPGIVIGRKGTLGKVIYLFENFFPIDTTYFVKSKVNSEGLFYEYFLLKTLNFEDMNTDSAVPGLNRDLALSTEIKIAPFEKLKRYNGYCASLFEKLKQNNSQIRTLTRLRDTLLPKLMSGEIRIKDSEKLVEAAS